MKKNRMVKIGDFPTGKNNNICDVDGVLVGHSTVDCGNNHTGVTAILPHNGNLFKNKVVAAGYAYNGFGKSMGLVQVEELGTVETPILLTNTLAIGNVSDGLISYMIKDNPEIGVTTSTVNPLVMECNDGKINKIQDRILNETNVYEAINDAGVNFKQGDVGAGCGMKCHGFKGGIGSSSRIVSIDGKDYTVGVLVNSNFGSSNGADLIFKGRALGSLIKDYDLKQEEDKGSIIVVLATNAPLDARQLKRIAKRAELGIARTGSYAGNGSGDIMLAFSTENKVTHDSSCAIDNIVRFSDNYINQLFKATVEATEEAVLNSMLYAKEKVSYNGVKYKSLMEYYELFKDLLS
ncbi:MAG: P1 family peptidase [Bacilli bacterium]|nr:P1 family peptidase [Bacilli bacterium]